ncbi:MAG: PqqD family protein [Prevotella sp.]|nr:PqqD family protein [Prevotella sp.]
MKAKKGFNLRTVCGEFIIVAEGKENIDFSNIISMNETSAYLWKKVQQMESFTVEDMAELLTEEYEVEKPTALKDAETLAAQWNEAGIIEP